MGTAERIERERLDRRARILDAARELFVERGVAAVTLREIAQRIEYSTTAIYVQFKDKAALVDAMVEEDFAAFATGLEATARIVDPVERIRALHVAYIDFALAMPRHYQLMFLSPPPGAPSKPVEHPTGIDGYRVLYGAVAECIASGRFRAEVADASAASQLVWAAVHGLVSLLIVLGSHDAFEWRSREILSALSYDVTLRGLLRDPDEVAAKKPRPKPRSKPGRRRAAR